MADSELPDDWNAGATFNGPAWLFFLLVGMSWRLVWPWFWEWLAAQFRPPRTMRVSSSDEASVRPRLVIDYTPPPDAGGQTGA
jgi:hypothetical protein